MNRSGLLSLLLVVGCGASTQSPNTVPEVSARRVPAPMVSAPATDPAHAFEVVRDESSSPIITLRAVFDAGSADDYRGFEGATFLAARLMAEGGAGTMTYAEVERALFSMAAEISFDVDRDQIAFVGRVHKDHLARFYPIFRDMLMRPRFEHEDYLRVLEQTKSELTLQLRSNDEEGLGKEMLQQLMYGAAHPYGHATRGTETSLSAMTLDAVRGQRNSLFCAARLRIGIGGSADAEFVATVTSEMNAWQGECRPRASVSAPEQQARRVLIVDKPDAASVAISMGMPIDVTRASEDYPALVLAMAYFGQHRQFSGLLMNKMRGDRGLNYGDYAYPEHFAQLGWTVYPRPNVARRTQYFSMWIRPVKPENAHFATRMAVRELERLVRDGLSQEDFERMRSYAGQYYAFFLQTEAQRLGFAIDDRTYGMSSPWLERLRAAWSQLTREQVNEALRRHLHPENLQIVMIAANGEQLANAIAQESASPITYPSEKTEEVLAEDREIQEFHLNVPRERINVMPISAVFH